VAHKLIQQYARPINRNEVQIIMPAAQDLLHFSMTDGQGVTIGRRHEAADYFPDIDLHEFPASVKVSRRHAELRQGRRGLEIVDLGSTNGTYIGTERLEPGVPYRVPNNAIIFLGTDFPIIIRYLL
jgi:pSer/pThr/pTyr-binding forkhead associated (FHA) protein